MTVNVPKQGRIRPRERDAVLQSLRPLVDEESL